MKTSLFPHQADLIDELTQLIREGYRRILLTCPTGSGKTVMAAHQIDRVARKGGCGFFVVHRKELADQAYRVIVDDCGLECGRIEAGIPPIVANRPQPMKVCVIQTLTRRLQEWQKHGRPPYVPNFVWWDEAHHMMANTWKTCSDYLRSINPNLIEIGLTATPTRLDGKPLGDRYEAMVEGPSTRELIDHSFLSPYKIIAPDTPLHRIREQLKKARGDFAAKDQSDQIKPHLKFLAKNAVDLYHLHANSKQGIFFGVDIEHSRMIAQSFRSAGIRSEHIDGTMNESVRSNVVRQFREGKIAMLTNCNLISEGFDVPEASCLIFGRATSSLVTWLQACGRVLRYIPGKVAVIIDQGWNYEQLGEPATDRRWTLDEGIVEGSASDDTDSKKLACPRCDSTNLRRQPNKRLHCRNCGYEWKAEATYEIQETDVPMSVVSTRGEQMEFPFVRNSSPDLANTASIAMDALLRKGKAY